MAVKIELKLFTSVSLVTKDQSLKFIRSLHVYNYLIKKVRMSLVKIVVCSLRTPQSAIWALSVSKEFRSSCRIRCLNKDSVGRSLIVLGSKFHNLGPIYLIECFPCLIALKSIYYKFLVPQRIFGISPLKMISNVFRTLILMFSFVCL